MSRPDARRIAQIHSYVVTSGLERNRFVAAGLARYAALGAPGVRPRAPSSGTSCSRATRAPDRLTHERHRALLAHAMREQPGARHREPVHVHVSRQGGRAAPFHAAAAARPLAGRTPPPWSPRYRPARHRRGVREGLWAHWNAVKNAFRLDDASASGLIAMYAPCGRLHTARALFDRAPDRSQAVYSSMIQAYGSHGHGVKALNLFDLMLANGVAPDGVCFVSVFSACAHGGLVSDAMGDQGVERRQVHYACVVDLLGRAGQLTRALAVVESMPLEPGKDVWGALLGGCRLHDDMELAERAAEHLLVLDPGNAGRYAALAQMFDGDGRWDDASRVRRIMRDLGVNKPLASSIVEGHLDAGSNRGFLAA